MKFHSPVDWNFTDADHLTYTVSGNSIRITGFDNTIKQYAFHDCPKLQGIKLPKHLAIIETRAFSGCSAITQLTIPASCTQVGDDAFLGCDALYAVTIEDDSTAFGKRSLGYLYDNGYMVKPGFVIDADTGTGVQYALDNGILRKSGLICVDVNADSSLTVLDAVIWLLSAGRLTNPAAGDLCEDGIINSFDLAAMKRRLLSET